MTNTLTLKFSDAVLHTSLESFIHMVQRKLQRKIQYHVLLFLSHADGQFNHSLRSYNATQQFLKASCVCTRSTSVLHIKLSNIKTTSLVALTDVGAFILKSFLQTKFPMWKHGGRFSYPKLEARLQIFSSLRRRSGSSSSTGCSGLGSSLGPTYKTSNAELGKSTWP